MSTNASQSTRVNLRIDATTKASLQRAAKVSGRSLTAFVLESALASANDLLSDRTQFTLSPKNWQKFNDLLDAPPREIPRLKRLLREKSAIE